MLNGNRKVNRWHGAILLEMSNVSGEREAAIEVEERCWEMINIMRVRKC